MNKRWPVATLVAVSIVAGACSSDGDGDGDGATTVAPSDPVAPSLEETVAPASSSDAGAAADPYRVAMILGTSGRTADQQQAVVRGAQAAARVLNAETGILGHPIEIEVFDSQGDPAVAVSILQEEVLTQEWDLLYPGGGGPSTGGMLPFVQREETLAFAPYQVATLPAADNPYFFSLIPPAADGAVGFAEYANSVGAQKVAIIHSADPYGEATAEAYGQAAEAAGIEVVSESYALDAVDVTPSLLKLQNQAPDLLFAIAFGAPAGNVMTSMERLGWDVPLIGDIGVGLTPLFSIVPDFDFSRLQVQAFAVNAWTAPEDRSEREAAFIDALAQDGSIDQGLQNYALGWDTIMLAFQGASIAGSTDAPSVAAALESLSLQEADRRFVAYDDFVLGDGDHVVSTGPDEYVVVPYTPLTDGMVGNTDT